MVHATASAEPRIPNLAGVCVDLRTHRKLIYGWFEDWDTTVSLLRQIVRALAGVRSLEEFVYLVGDSWNGKDTLVALMLQALGDGMVAHTFMDARRITSNDCRFVFVCSRVAIFFCWFVFACSRPCVDPLECSRPGPGVSGPGPELLLGPACESTRARPRDPVQKWLGLLYLARSGEVIHPGFFLIL